MNTLSFNSNRLNVIPRNNKPWLTSADLAKALGYSSQKSVTTIFNRNKDEFSDSMTSVINLMTNGINGSKRKMKVRIFSLRGAHLLAMFANTKMAKEFRRWVLDILDKEAGNQRHSTTDERTGLRNAVNLLVSKKGLMYPEAYNLIHHRFNVEHLDELTKDQLPQAVEYVHRLVLEGEYLPASSNLLPGFASEQEANATWTNLHALCRHAEMTLKVFDECGMRRFLRQLDSKPGRQLIEHVQSAGRLAGMVHQSCQELIIQAKKSI